MLSYAISKGLRFVLDTDVRVAAVRSQAGASWQLVDRALKREFTLLLSVPLVLEYEAVLTREEYRKVHRLTRLDIDKKKEKRCETKQLSLTVGFLVAKNSIS